MKKKLYNVVGHLPKIWFVCGAKFEGKNSIRKLFIKYIQKNHQEICTARNRNSNSLSFSPKKIILAEDVLEQSKTKDTKILDYEEHISEFSTNVIFFLESPSVFMEIGRFTKTITDPLKFLFCVDQKHKKKKNLINKLLSDPKYTVLHYTTNNDIIINSDDFFKKVLNCLNKTTPTISYYEDNIHSFYSFLISFLQKEASLEQIIRKVELERKKTGFFSNFLNKIKFHLKLLIKSGLILKQDCFYFSVIRGDILKGVKFQALTERQKELLFDVEMNYSYEHIKDLVYEPNSTLKNYQAFIKTRVFDPLEEEHKVIHKRCFSYKKKHSISNLVELHIGNNYLLNMDLKNFFNSIKREDFIKCMVTLGLFEERFRTKITDICFKTKSNEINGLPIGARTSPFISNLVMREFDNLVYNLCEKKEVVYTRYSDDLSFSCKKKGVLQDIEKEIYKVIKKLPYPQNLKINEKKTKHMSKKGRRKICGLYITPESHISIGRKNKNKVKNILKNFNKTEKIYHNKEMIKIIQESFLDSEEKGYLYYVNSVEKEFLKSQIYL
ncbi:MAG: RNA-directed DNA polymerase [Bdellovibrionales bacterium]|nr:RNA-directed DNA polymerase [Bdellovibrionales bacterium]